MHELANLQHAFAEVLKGGEASEALLQTLAQGEALPPQARLGLYRNSVTGVLTHTLSEQYSVCERLVGEVFFAGMAAYYIRQTASNSPDLNDYGAGFADFIAGFEHAQGLPYLADVARLEWAWQRAYFGPVEAQDVASIIASNLEANQVGVKLQLDASSSLISSNYPILAIWQSNQPGAAEPPIRLDQGGDKLLVGRFKGEQQIVSVSEANWQLLSLMQQGVSLAELAACWQGSEQAFTESLKQVLLNWWVVTPELE